MAVVAQKPSRQSAELVIDEPSTDVSSGNEDGGDVFVPNNANNTNTIQQVTACYHGALIDGQWMHAHKLKRIQVTNPSNGEKVGEISACQAQEVEAALAAAERAAPAWAAASIDDRAKLIMAYQQKLVERKDDIIRLLVAETGKVTGNADYDFTMLVKCLPFHVEEMRRNYGSVFPSPDGSALSYTRYSPVGVVACVLTWNFPLLNLAYKLGPILASGCTTVIKPSEFTPLATCLALSLLSEVSFPAGVINVVNGTGLDVIEPLCSSRIPRLVTTIGSTTMGRRMIGYSATSIKRFSLELGGDAPVVVFADADLDAAIAAIVDLKFANAGQICVSPNRVFVHNSVYEAFLTRAVAIASEYVFGSGNDHNDKENAKVLQPVVSEASLDRLLALIADAKCKGGRIMCGGAREDRQGFFLQPTIIADCTDSMKCQEEEIFGPILPVRSFRDDDDVFALANDSEYGLSSYVFTKSLDLMLRAEQELMTGNVCINGVHYSIELPHGGVKQSGCGKDISHLSLRDYLDIRRITIKR